jgi:uncharacterized repeat protein (TIGR03803 family)
VALIALSGAAHSQVVRDVYEFSATGSGQKWGPLRGGLGRRYLRLWHVVQAHKIGHIAKHLQLSLRSRGALPGALLQASDGNFYGMTDQGGTANLCTIFKMNQLTMKITVLHPFVGDNGDGKLPTGGLVQATDGNLYGETSGGGSSNDGVLFRLTTTGNYKVIYNFQETTGSGPLAAPLQHTNGLLYGTLQLGGTFGEGAVYSLDLGLRPFTTFVRPTGKVGQTAQILGTGLTGATSVTFSSVAATKFSVVSDTYMTAVVPAGATTGAVVVATPAGNLTSNVSFRISK